MPVPLSAICKGEFVAVDVTVMPPATVPAEVGANLAVTVAVAPAAIVCPLVIPLSLKPVPDALTLLIVIVEPPEFVSAIASVLLLPTATLLKLKLPGFAPNVLPAATALPVMVNVCGDPGPLSVNWMLPVTPVVEVGVNDTLNVVDWLTPIVAGKLSPLIPNPVPATDAVVTSRLVFPVLLRVTFWVLVWPTVTLLKFSELGENAGTASRPPPLIPTTRVVFVALLVIVKFPVAAVVEVGANWTSTVALCPTANEAVGFPPITVNTPPVMVAPDIFTVPVPVFVTLTLWVALLPTVTFPKLIEEGEGVRTPPPEPPTPPPVPLVA
jgi:hypothetical protein